MSAADVHTLTGAYALDALDDAERAVFEAHLAGCAACREEVAALRETAARLTDGVAVAPPPVVRTRVLAQARATPQLPPRGTPDAAGPTDVTDGRDEVAARRRRQDPARRAALPWMVAAAVATVLAVAGTGFGVAQRQQAREARLVAEQVTGVLADPSARRSAADVAGGGRVALVIAGDRAVLTTAGLPALPPDRVYQVWLVRPDGIRSAGLGPAGQDAAGGWQRPVTGVRPGDRVAVSVEPAGGSQQPTTTPLVAVEV